MKKLLVVIDMQMLMGTFAGHSTALRTGIGGLRVAVKCIGQALSQVIGEIFSPRHDDDRRNVQPPAVLFVNQQLQIGWISPKHGRLEIVQLLHDLLRGIQRAGNTQLALFPGHPQQP